MAGNKSVNEALAAVILLKVILKLKGVTYIISCRFIGFDHQL
jgi:hypothetical protein